MLTHFFVLQKVLPHRIQQKYFQMIKSKLLDQINVIKSRESHITSSNHSTKSFFNFTYKKYRFYFGIYTSCNHFYDPSLPAPNNFWSHDTKAPVDANEAELYDFFNRQKQCTVPSPFMMSQNQRACVMHQRNHHKDSLNHNRPTEPKKQSSKMSKSEKCFLKRCNKIITPVNSSHLGISYKMHINTNGRKYIKHTPSGYIYQKALTDYQINTNFKTKTLKKQER
jgi:hypothetical protein